MPWSDFGSPPGHPWLHRVHWAQAVACCPPPPARSQRTQIQDTSILSSSIQHSSINQFWDHLWTEQHGPDGVEFHFYTNLKKNETNVGQKHHKWISFFLKLETHIYHVEWPHAASSLLADSFSWTFSLVWGFMMGPEHRLSVTEQPLHWSRFPSNGADQAYSGLIGLSSVSAPLKEWCNNFANWL